jgi:uncharacterized protein (TIGR03083 family)
MDIWDEIGKERRSLDNYLHGLSPEDWSRPSLCTGWTVRDAATHILVTAQKTPFSSFGDFAKARFRFQTMVKNDLGAKASLSIEQLLAEFDAIVTSRSAPPGPKAGWLGEVIVHGEDIRRSLGEYGEHDPAALIAAANFYKGSNTLIGTKSRISGMELQATDVDWRWGSGPLVRGPMVALLMAMTGRHTPLEDLEGPGVSMLREKARVRS